MRNYIIRRFLLMIPVLWLVTLGAFALIRLVPGDVLLSMVQQSGNVPAKDLERIRHEMGLDKSIWQQYVSWMNGMFHGDMGKSLYTKKPVARQILKTLPITIELGLMILIISLVLGLSIGILSAIRQDTALDYAGRLIAIGGLSFPDFWLATMFVVFVPLYLHYMPHVGLIPFLDNPLRNLEQFIFPALIAGFQLSATGMRMTRSAMLEVLRQDYVRTAWSKGLRERAVIMRHAVKNAMIPVVTIFGAQMTVVVGGSLIMEVIFALPGMGRLTYEAILGKDFPQVQANVTFLAMWIVVMNLVVDISYAWLDPRIRFS